jgi:acyl-CoA synthetase (AMP-forming)/AMP-acid ligase II
MVIKNIIESARSKYPERIGVVYGNVRLSFKNIFNRSNSLANALVNMGTKKGERIAIISRNSHIYYEIPYAITKIGLIVVPVNYRLNYKDIEYIIEDSDPKIIIYEDEFSEIANKFKNRICISISSYESLISSSKYNNNFADIIINEDDPAYIFYTSGTTGKPKGVILTHRNIIAGAINMAREVGFSPDDVILITQPLCHVGAIILMASAVAGSRVVIINFDPKIALKIIEEERVTIIKLVPTILEMLISHSEMKNYDLRSLRMILYSASPMSKSLLMKGRNIFGEIFVQMYGLTETSTISTILRAEEHINGKIESIGREVRNIKVRIFDDDDREVPINDIGEIVIKGENVTEGYWKLDDETERVLRNGWLHTGDIGKVDKEGYIYLVGRKDDMIKSGGLKIYPKEIEEVIINHPKVEDVGVLGIPHKRWGEAICAFVVVKEGEVLAEDEIISLCKRSLPGYKIPKYIRFMKALPRNNLGKLNRKALKYTL